MHVLWIIIKKKIEWDYRNIINDKFSHIFFSQVKSINGNDIILERCFILIKKKKILLFQLVSKYFDYVMIV